MKRNSFLSLLFSLSFTIAFAQTEKPRFISWNLAPLKSTAIELGYQQHLNSKLTLEGYLGYVVNCKFNSPIKVGTLVDFEKKSGTFLKLGARYNFRKDLSKFAPFMGLSLVNALAIEKGQRYQNFYEYTGAVNFQSNSYNLGLNGLIGITSPASKKLNVDLGLQIGRLVIDRLADFHSYMPGMGVSFGGGWHPQFIVRINYRLN